MSNYFPSGPGTKDLGQPQAPFGLMRFLRGEGRGEAGGEAGSELSLDSICPFTKHSLAILTLHQLLSSGEERDRKDKVSVLRELELQRSGKTSSRSDAHSSGGSRLDLLLGKTCIWDLTAKGILWRVKMVGMVCWRVYMSTPHERGSFGKKESKLRRCLP